MRQLTELQIQKVAMLKAKRAAIGLKYRLMADAEIYRELPKLEERIDAALARSEPLELNPGSVFYEDEQ